MDKGSGDERESRRTVEIARSLEVGMPKLAERTKRLCVPSLHHVPTRRFRAEENLQSDDDCRNTSLYAHGQWGGYRLQRSILTLPSISLQFKPVIPL